MAFQTFKNLEFRILQDKCPWEKSWKWILPKFWGESSSNDIIRSGHAFHQLPTHIGMRYICRQINCLQMIPKKVKSMYNYIGNKLNSSLRLRLMPFQKRLFSSKRTNILKHFFFLKNLFTYCNEGKRNEVLIGSCKRGLGSERLMLPDEIEESKRNPVFRL